MKIFSKTDIGLKRENNQDAYATGVFDDGNVWAIVCDGMGGVAGGQVASSICVDVASSVIKAGYNSDMTVSDVKLLLRSSIDKANDEVFKKASEDFSLKGMGTTIVAVIILESTAVIAHVGDSRAYTVDFGKNEITPVTKDHSLVQFYVDNGRITEEMAKFHPDRNIITRAIGIEKNVECDMTTLSVSGRSLLICSDGLNGYVEDEDIFNTIKADISSAAENLVKIANETGGHDNVTVVLIQGE